MQSSLFLVSLENVTLGSCGALFFDSRVFQCGDLSFPRSDLTLTGSLSFERRIKTTIFYVVAIHSRMYDYAEARKEFR